MINRRQHSHFLFIVLVALLFSGCTKVTLNEKNSSDQRVSQNASGAIRTDSETGDRLPLTETVSFRKNGIGLTFKMPKNWIDEHIADPNRQIAFDFQERSPFLLVYSPFYNAAFKQIVDSGVDTATDMRMYVSATYFLDTKKNLEDWYAEHRKELINTFGMPVEEQTIAINGVPAKSIVFTQADPADEYNTVKRFYTYHYVYLARSDKVYQVMVDVRSELYQHFLPTIEDILQSVRFP